ncbi:ATP-binding protein [Candidatus Uhrbacteria bacterium]|nr:ATP-binding protein [Candidatus Uhrbacteria bacterium]
MLIKRYYQNLDEYITPGKVLIIYGPRRVGKTTLLKSFLEETKVSYKLDSGDNIITQQILGSNDFRRIFEYAAGYDLLALDEAQQIPNIGVGLKILVDQKPNLKIIATGSSSFDLAQKTGEPLTGRKRTLTLFPMSQEELLSVHTLFELKQHVEDFLIFGSYPEIITQSTSQEKIRALQELVSSSLLKDIFTLENIRLSRAVLDLVKLLAFQIGSEVSHHELATQLGINVKTVERYLDLLEKTFVIFRLGAFSRNLRNEIRNKQKYYFYDTGIRNAFVNQFNPLSLRDDVGKLWENFIIAERMKYRSYHEIYGNTYFWRTYEQQEIDLIEEREARLSAYEMKWKPSSAKPPKSFFNTYPKSEYTIVHADNYMDFIL